MTLRRFASGALGLTLLLFAATPAMALREPQPSHADHRVSTVMYQVDQVYKFTGHYGFQSAIEFAPDETIQTISMGDSTAWMVQPSGNRLFLKPIEQGATTNMTLITDKHIYLFELHAKEAQKIDDEDMSFLMRFTYGNNGAAGGGDAVVQHYNSSIPVPDIERDRERYNFNYSISGPDTIAPIRIFDDGEFTFFQFRGRNTEVPAFFMVDSEGNEGLINYRTVGDYIVVERVSGRFTLRHGADIVCVWNEAYKQQLKSFGLPQPDKK